MSKKNAFYFTHDYNARSDPKIKKLLAKHGVSGYGIYWSIIEDLYQNANALPTDYDTIAYDLRTETAAVKSIINDFDLFFFDGDFFGSKSVDRRLHEREEKSIKARESAKARWDKNNKNNTNTMRTHSERNASAMLIKEKKRKEKKGNKNTVPMNDITKIDVNHSDTETDKIGQDIQKFVKGFMKRFSVSFSREDISALRNSANKYWKDIEIEFYSMEIFLRTMLKRMEDINAARTINNPISFFFAGAFGENRYLWDRTAKEESNGPGYNKEMINLALAKENGGVSAGLKAMV